MKNICFSAKRVEMLMRNRLCMGMRIHSALQVTKLISKVVIKMGKSVSEIQTN